MYFIGYEPIFPWEMRDLSPKGDEWAYRFILLVAEVVVCLLAGLILMFFQQAWRQGIVITLFALSFPAFLFAVVIWNKIATMREVAQTQKQTSSDAGKVMKLLRRDDFVSYPDKNHEERYRYVNKNGDTLIISSSFRALRPMIEVLIDTAAFDDYAEGGCNDCSPALQKRIEYYVAPLIKDEQRKVLISALHEHQCFLRQRTVSYPTCYHEEQCAIRLWKEDGKFQNHKPYWILTFSADLE